MHIDSSSAHEEHSGHVAMHSDHGEGHVGHSEATCVRPCWISLILTIPVPLYDHMIQEWLGFRMPTFPGSPWLTPALASIIY